MQLGPFHGILMSWRIMLVSCPGMSWHVVPCSSCRVMPCHAHVVSCRAMLMLCRFKMAFLFLGAEFFMPPRCPKEAIRPMFAPQFQPGLCEPASRPGTRGVGYGPSGCIITFVSLLSRSIYASRYTSCRCSHVMKF